MAMADSFNPTEWITTAEAADLTGYTTALIRYLARNQHIEAQKFGRDWMIKRWSVQVYADEMRRLGTAKHDPTRAHDDT